MPGTILGRFGVDLGGSEVSGASAGAGRGALSSKLTFSALASVSGSILRLPDPLSEALRPFLGALWAPLVAPWPPLRVPRGLSGALRAPLWRFLRPSGALWGALGPPDGSLGALGTVFRSI